MSASIRHSALLSSTVNTLNCRISSEEPFLGQRAKFNVRVPSARRKSSPSDAASKDRSSSSSSSSASKAAPAYFAIASSSEDPLLLRAARREKVERPPAWMMRQAGRYMSSYRKLAEKHPSFRERSEVTDLIVKISLQPWDAFKPDGVIIFSDILTPLPAIGLPFEIDDAKGPIIDSPIRSEADLSALHAIDLSTLSFISESFPLLRSEVGDQAAVLGFIGAPWTLATYCVEGRSTRTYTIIKSMIHHAPQLLQKLLSILADQIGAYANFQIDSGAQCIQIFDSWGGQLPPHQWDAWSKPYIQQVVKVIRSKHPETPLVMYANGSGGLLERMAAIDVDVIGLDWTIDMLDGRQRVGDKAVQGNVDPAVLFASKDAVYEAVKDVVLKAGPEGHILNLGHGVLVGTPEECVAHFFDTARSMSYSSLF